VHRVASLLKRWLPGTHQGAVAPEYPNAGVQEMRELAEVTRVAPSSNSFSLLDG
jgi:hypothetical protein